MPASFTQTSHAHRRRAADLNVYPDPWHHRHHHWNRRPVLARNPARGASPSAGPVLLTSAVPPPSLGTFLARADYPPPPGIINHQEPASSRSHAVNRRELHRSFRGQVGNVNWERHGERLARWHAKVVQERLNRPSSRRLRVREGSTVRLHRSVRDHPVSPHLVGELDHIDWQITRVRT